ncbi:MAG: WG repeat-containing protein, partial [Aureispira sp.]|nr:WG repeat-containing protein [Aureispira sp.]
MWRPFLVVILVITAFVTQAQQHLYPVHIDKKWGMIDVNGKLVVKPYYQAIGVFQEGLYAIAEKEGLLGVLDTTGALVIPCQYTLMDYVGRGLFSVKTATTSWKVINTKERLILDDMAASIQFLDSSFLSYEEITGLGLADLKKGVLLPPKFREFKFLNNTFIVATDAEDLKSIYDYDGNEILVNNYEEIEIKNNLIWAKRSGKWGAFTLKGASVIQHEWLSYKAIGSNFYCFTNEEEQSVLYSVELNTVILKNVEEVDVFDENHIQVLMPSGTRSLIDLAGQIVLSGKYGFITKFGKNTFRIKEGRFQGVLNDKGAVIIPFIYNYIGNLNTSVAPIRKGKRHGIVNLNGEVVIPIAFPNALELNDNNVRYKDTSGNLQLFVFDENGQMSNNTKFSNLKSLKVRSSGRRRRQPIGSIMLPPDSNPYQISDSLCWKFHSGARKWGLWHIQEKRYKFTPQWASVKVFKEQGLSIVEKKKQGIGGALNTGRIRLKIHEIFGVFTNVHGLPVTAMEFLDIRTSDFTVKNLSVARCVFIGGQQGIIADNGRVITRGFAYIGDFVEGKARATKKGQLLVDLAGKKKRPIGAAVDHFHSFMATCHFDNDDDPKYYRVFEKSGKIYCDNAKWGYLDTFGILNSPFKYDYVEDYSNDRALVRKDGKWGMLDEEGNEVLEPAYDNFNFLPNSDRKLFFIAQNSVLHGAIDSNANVIVPVKYSKVRTYHEDRVAVKNLAGRWGFVNRTGKEVVKAKYRVARDFSEGLAIIFDQSRWGAINPSGGVSIKPQYLRMGDFKEGKAWVHLAKGKKGYIDKNGNLLFSKRFSRLTNFKNGIARVYIRKKGWGLINAKGEYILKPKKSYEKIEAFNEYGLAKVKIGNKYRLMDEAGALVGKKAYGKIRDFQEGFA